MKRESDLLAITEEFAAAAGEIVHAESPDVYRFYLN